MSTDKMLAVAANLMLEDMVDFLEFQINKVEEQAKTAEVDYSDMDDAKKFRFIQNILSAAITPKSKAPTDYDDIDGDIPLPDYDDIDDDILPDIFCIPVPDYDDIPDDEQEKTNK